MDWEDLDGIMPVMVNSFKGAEKAFDGPSDREIKVGLKRGSYSVGGDSANTTRRKRSEVIKLFEEGILTAKERNVRLAGIQTNGAKKPRKNAKISSFFKGKAHVVTVKEESDVEILDAQPGGSLPHDGPLLIHVDEEFTPPLTRSPSLYSSAHLSDHQSEHNTSEALRDEAETLPDQQAAGAMPGDDAEAESETGLIAEAELVADCVEGVISKLGKCR
jgi:hypothetical protein